MKKHEWTIVVKQNNVLGLFKSKSRPNKIIDIGGYPFQLKTINESKRIAIYIPSPVRIENYI